MILREGQSWTSCLNNCLILLSSHAHSFGYEKWFAWYGANVSIQLEHLYLFKGANWSSKLKLSSVSMVELCYKWKSSPWHWWCRKSLRDQYPTAEVWRWSDPAMGTVVGTHETVLSVITSRDGSFTLNFMPERCFKNAAHWNTCNGEHHCNQKQVAHTNFFSWWFLTLVIIDVITTNRSCVLNDLLGTSDS